MTFKHLISPYHFFAKRNIIKKIQESGDIRLNVGSGGTEYFGWFSLEKYVLDVTSERDWARILQNRKAENILAEHVFEHLEYADILKAFINIKKFLAPGGLFRFAVPDGNHPSKYVRDLTKPGGEEPGANDHKYFFTINDIAELEKVSGLRAEPIEYFDNEGIFHHKEIDFNQGYVSRCSVNYQGRFTESQDEMSKLLKTLPFHLHKQFREIGISYTSLLIDWQNQN